MKKAFFKIMNLVVLIAFVFGLSCVGTTAFAGTLTETLKKLFNEDIGDFVTDFTKEGKLKTFEVMPFRIINVKGDAAKFRAINWMDDGVTGGIKEMTYEGGDVKKGDHLSFEGHAIPGDNDLGAKLELTKGNGGYITMDYGNFRKWYDVYGGYFADFVVTPISRLAADPKMDMGHFNLEIGSGPENDPGISLGFEHDSKDGIKSMLQWGTVTEGGKTRKIIPSWQEMSETTDAIVLKGRADVAGFRVNGQQRAEFFSGRTFREDYLTTTPTFQRQEQEPFAKQLTSSLKADRWIINDKTYLSFAYQFQHLRQDMLETISVNNADGTISNNSHNHYVDAQSDRDSNAWVQHFAAQLMPNLNLVTKFKEEIITQTGSGFAQGYGGSSGTNITPDTEDKITRTGQSVSLRYNGIPKTSLYSDFDFQQTRNWLSKWQKIDATSVYYENVNRDPEITAVVGVRYVPNSKVTMTSQLRHKTDNNTYNTLANNDVGIAISRLRTDTNEINNRLTWKPLKWFQNSLRVQLADNIYRVQALDQTALMATLTDRDWIKSNGTSRVYTYDAVLQPWDEWMFDLGASLNRFKVSTPASQKNVGTTDGGIPVFVADVYTLLFSTSYTPKENFSIFTSAQYSRANDFDSHGFAGIPYGVNNESYDVTIGAKWSPKKNLTLEPHYGYYSYRANPNDNYSMDYGNYTAHVVWLDTKFTW